MENSFRFRSNFKMYVDIQNRRTAGRTENKTVHKRIHKWRGGHAERPTEISIDRGTSPHRSEPTETEGQTDRRTNTQTEKHIDEATKGRINRDGQTDRSRKI